MTFYQNSVPADIMGRVGSLNGLLESVFIIAITLLFGLLSESYAIRPVVIGGVIVMLLLGIAIALLIAKIKRLSKMSTIEHKAF